MPFPYPLPRVFVEFLAYLRSCGREVETVGLGDLFLTVGVVLSSAYYLDVVEAFVGDVIVFEQNIACCLFLDGNRGNKHTMFDRARVSRPKIWLGILGAAETKGAIENVTESAGQVGESEEGEGEEERRRGASCRTADGRGDEVSDSHSC